jgi:DNA-binding NtrC family response regulator
MSGSATVLVVTNNEQIRSLMGANLSHAGFAPILARSAFDALEAVRNGRAAAVVMSAGFLAGGGGWIVAEQMREIAPALPIVLVAEWNEPRPATPKKLAGPHTVVLNPSRLADLGSAVGALIEKSEG